jgi:hypothetical protein
MTFGSPPHDALVTLGDHRHRPSSPLSSPARALDSQANDKGDIGDNENTLLSVCLARIAAERNKPPQACVSCGEESYFAAYNELGCCGKCYMPRLRTKNDLGDSFSLAELERAMDEMAGA